MKLAALLFFVLLVWAHQVCGLDRPLLQPLCDFREGEHGSLGYALFAAIGLIGALYAIGLRRLGRAGEAANATGSGLLLLLIAATPSEWIWHRAAAMALLSSIFVHYALVLTEGPRALLVLHASAPLVRLGDRVDGPLQNSKPKDVARDHPSGSGAPGTMHRADNLLAKALLR